MTADRPIAECLGSGQRELNASGTLRRAVGPAYSAVDQEVIEARERQAAMAEGAQLETRRRERALLTRYPSAEAHEHERLQALSTIDSIVGAARLYLQTLSSERRRMDDELEFYRRDPSKAPASLLNRLSENTESVAAQKRFVEQQEEERGRVNARFENERLRLVPLWRASAAH